jgi:hypothetical protein
MCDLAPGSYRFTAMDRPGDPNSFKADIRSFVVTTINITDRDLNGLKFTTAPGVPLQGEIVLDGPTPEQPIKARLFVFLEAQLRTTLGEKADARVNIPDTFSFPSIPLDDYYLRLTLNARGLYIKDVTYTGRSIKDEVFHFGNTMPGAGLRITIAQDGGLLNATVADKDSNPLPDMHVIFFPADIPSEGIFAERIVSGLSDQTGGYQSATLAPGKYYVAATSDQFDYTVECVARLWRSRNRFQEVNISPGGSAAIKLEPITLE